MKKLFAVGVCLLGSGLLAGCETAGRPPAAPAPISVITPSSSSPGLDTGQNPAQMLQVTATVMNDSSNKGVTWTCTFTPSGGAAAACANFPSMSTGCSTCMATFTDPGSTGSVSITATSIADSTKSSPSALKFNVNPRPTFPAPAQVVSQLQASSPSCNASSPGGTVTLGPTAGTAYNCGFAAAFSGGTPPITWSAPGLSQVGLTINSSTGVISGTPTGVTKLRSGGSLAGRLTASSDPMVTVTAMDSSPNMVLMPITIAINVALGFTNVAVPSSGTAGQPYMGNATAGGGTTPYHWTVSGLPNGLTSNAASATTTTTVTISGTPTQSGNFTVMISVTDSESPAVTVSATIMLTIAAPPPLTITTATLPTGDVNLPYNATLQATGGIPPDTWSAGAGTLPAGLMLSPDGHISGTPTMAGTFGFTVQVVDSETPPMMATKSLSITINPQLAVTTTTLPDGTVGTAYSTTTLASSGGTPPVTWAVTTGTLPAGLMLTSATGAISGTPTTAGTSTFTVTATDHLNQSATQSLSITIHPAPLSITTMTLPSGTVNSPYNQTVSATGGTPPYTFTVTSGSLPTGLTLTTSNNQGVISGTPTATGTFPFTVQVMDSATPAATATQALSITINVAVTCTQTQTNLCGRFTFGFQGADANGPVAMAGSILTDGTNVVSGEIDMNHVAPTTLGNFNFLHGTINASPASSFSFDPTTKLGTLTLNISHGTLTLTRTFALALAPDRPEGRLIAFDSSGISGSGAIGAPDTTAFNTAAIKGNYALSFIGGDGLPHRVGMLAIFNADGSGNLTTANNGSVTINVGGTVGTGLNFGAGAAYGQIDATTGRGFAGFTITGAGDPLPPPVLNFFFHIVNANELFFIGSTAVTPGSAEPILSGFAESQAFPQPFSIASIPCGVGVNLPCVFTLIGPSGASIGLATVTSQGPPGMMTLLIDANMGGIIVSNTPITGFTFTVQPAGNGTLVPPPGNPIVKHNIDFVTGGAGAFILDEGTDVDSGLLQPQQSTSLRNPPGEFIGVTQAAPPASATMAVAFAALTASTGPGSISGTADGNGGTPTSGITFSGTYELASNGRATGSVTLPGLATFTFYVVKGGRFVLIGQTPGQGGVLFEFGRHGGDILP